MSSKEIIIVGGGVIGCSTAYHLAKKGFYPQIIERDSVGSQASGRAWATLSELMTMDIFQGIGLPPGETVERVAPPFRPFIKETLDRMTPTVEELKKEAGMDTQFAELPALYLAFLESEEEYLRNRVKELQSEAIEISWIGADDVRALYPDIHPAVRGGVTFPGVQIEPYRFTVALGQAAEKMGANIRHGDVVDFKYEGSKVIAVKLATGTELEGDVFVLTMGVHLGQGTAKLEKEMFVRPFQVEYIRLQLPEQLPNYRLGAASITFIPKPDGTTLVSIGSLSGNMGVPQADGSVTIAQPLDYEWRDDFNDKPTESIKEAYTEAAVITLPRTGEGELTEHTAGLLTGLPNEALGTMGRLPGFDNVYVCTAEIGIMLSLSCGRLMSELILDGKVDEDISIFDPARSRK